MLPPKEFKVMAERTCCGHTFLTLCKKQDNQRFCSSSAHQGGLHHNFWNGGLDFTVKEGIEGFSDLAGKKITEWEAIGSSSCFGDRDFFRLFVEGHNQAFFIPAISFFQTFDVVWEPTEEKSIGKSCTCEIRELMMFGCECGGFEAEQLSKRGGD